MEDVLENILMEMYPVKDGDCDHFNNHDKCPCNPVVVFVDFQPFRYHERINTEQKIYEKRPDKIPIDWN